MTREEKKRMLDAIDAAEKEARERAEALKLPADVESVLYRFAGRLRAVVHAENGDVRAGDTDGT